MTTQTQDKLFSPYQLGPYTLEHRVVMPPLTRLRSNPDDNPSDMMVEHYRQRASKGGLIIIEAAAVSRNGIGYAAHTRTQYSYFGKDGLLRRHLYQVDILGGAQGANYAATIGLLNESNYQPGGVSSATGTIFGRCQSQCSCPSI